MMIFGYRGQWRLDYTAKKKIILHSLLKQNAIESIDGPKYLLFLFYFQAQKSIHSDFFL